MGGCAIFSAILPFDLFVMFSLPLDKHCQAPSVSKPDIQVRCSMFVK